MPRKKVEPGKRKKDMSECTNGLPKPDTFWAPTLKYNDLLHPDMLIRIANENGWKSDFCVAADICCVTFNEWVEKYPKFADAWGRAREIVRAKMERDLAYPSEQSVSSIQYLYNVRFKPNAVRVKNISKAVTSSDAVKCVAEAIVAEELESVQLNAALKFVETKVIVEESAKQDERISKLEATHGVQSGTEQEA